MKSTAKKSLAWLLSLAMIISMMTAAMIPVWAEETAPDAEAGTEPVASSEAIPAEVRITTPIAVEIDAVEGQEYVIAPKGTDPDWSKAVDPTQYEESTTYYVDFLDLTPAETYVIYTRIKGSEGTPAATEVTLSLESIGISSDKGDVVGSTFTAEPDPNPEGLTYQWFYDEMKEGEEGAIQHNYTAIEGATSASYTVKPEDLGKYISVSVYNKYGEEVMDHSTEHGPMAEGDDPTPVALSFTDVNEDDYFYTPVKWAVRHDPQITNGTSETTFSPEQDCTRGQVVTFLWRAAGCPEPASTENKFTDVTDKDYFYKAVLWAVEKKITNGMTDTTFGPEQSCTRGQVAAFLWRAANSPEPTSSTNTFTDVTDKDYFYKAVLWAVEKDITKGTGEGLFSPEQTCTRGQIVTFLYRSE